MHPQVPMQVTPVSADSRPSVPYTRRAPSPPFIQVQQHVPGPENQPLTIRPRFGNGDPGFMTEYERTIITNNADLEAYDGSVGWEYRKRHEAQQITDWLYIGPRSMIKERKAWIQSEGITMIILVHESGLTPLMEMFARNTASNLGIEARCVVADSALHLMKHFSDVVQLINSHLVGVYQHQTTTLGLDGANTRRGKILVTCQTGNDRANIVAAAYIMATYGCGMSTAVNFVGLQRFCCDFNEDAKRALLSWGEIIDARAAVNRAKTNSQTANLAPPQSAHQSRKRSIHDMDEDVASESAGTTDTFTRQTMDEDRFSGRTAFKPFVDVHDQGTKQPHKDTMQF